MPHNHRPAVGPRETALDAVAHDPDAAHRATTPEAVAAAVGHHPLSAAGPRSERPRGTSACSSWAPSSTPSARA